MFKEARIKLTTWYLVIVMAISLSFSGVIYIGVNRELTRIESFQRVRIQRIINGFPAPFEPSPIPDSDAISEARLRIISTLGMINLIILAVAGLGGYFLAGRTLNPISEMMEDQKKFVGDASHELRTPLTALKTEIEVALRDRKMSFMEMKKLLQSNLEDVNRMQKLSNYLLKLNKYENSRSDLQFTRVDLKEVVLKATKIVGTKNLKLSLKKSLIKGNEDALTELFIILLDNALKYGKGKSIEVRVKSGGIVEIQDHGEGIAREDVPHIFDRFYRADKSRSKDGYGLGLSIAKNIVELHNGKIEVDTKIGKGSTFRVTI